MPICLSTIKNQESHWFPCVHVACHIPLENFRWSIQIYLRLHLNWRFAHKIMGLQSCEVPILGISRLSLGSPGTKWHLGVGLVVRHIVYYKREGGDFPNLSHSESCEFMFDHGSFVHQKCFNFALINLLFSLCRFVWIIELLVTLPSPIPELQHTLKCHEPGSVLNFFSFRCLHLWIRNWIHQGAWGGSQMTFVKLQHQLWNIC